MHALVRARARDEVPPRRLIGSPGPRTSLFTSLVYLPHRYASSRSSRLSKEKALCPISAKLGLMVPQPQKKEKQKACFIRVDWLGGYFFRNCGSIHYKVPFQGNASQIFFILRSCSFTETRARYHPPQHGPYRAYCWDLVACRLAWPDFLDFEISKNGDRSCTLRVS